MQITKKQAGIIVLLVFASLLILVPIQTVKAQTATVSVSPKNNIVSVGQTLTVNIEISNVQNLYGVDIALTWDTSMLKLVSNQSFVPVSNGIGILNPKVLVVQDTADQSTGEYNLIATSEYPAGPFSGSGTVATLTFTVTSTGQSSLTLKSSTSSSPQLASYVAPNSGESQPISVTVVNGNVSTTSSSPSPTASQTPSTSSPSSSPSTTSTPSPATATPSVTSSSPIKSAAFPELIAAIVVVVIVVVALAVVLSRRKH